LEKQLAEQKESYTDTLIDQGLDAMEKSYEATAEYQRSMIDFKQKQLDYDEKTNAYEQEAREMLQALSKDGAKIENTAWYALFEKMNPNMTSGALYSKTVDVESAISAINTWMKSIWDPSITAKEAAATTNLDTLNTGDKDNIDVVKNTVNNNNSAEVKKVQAWLNKNFNSNLKEDGSWGTLSKQAAKTALGELAKTGNYYSDAKTAMENFDKA